MNVKKVIIGLILIICSVGLAIFSFYFVEVKPELASRPKEVVVEKAQQKVVVEYEGEKNTVKEVVKENEPQKEPEKQIKVNEASVKKSGHLWIDRKSSKYVVTLGKRNGLQVGSKLVVYQNEEKIGKIEVDKVYDTIAYVHLLDISTELSDNDYYRVEF